MFSEKEVSFAAVGPLRPSGEAWNIFAYPGQELRPVDTVEGVFEVQLDEALSWVTSVALAPCPADMNSGVNPQGASHSDLERGEEGLGGFFDLGAQRFPDHSSPHLSHSNRADPSFRFRQGHQPSSCEVWRDLGGGGAPGKGSGHRSYLLQ